MCQSAVSAFLRCRFVRELGAAKRAVLPDVPHQTARSSVGMQQLSLDDFVPKALPDAAPAVQRLEARGMAADVAARTVRQEALQCLTKRM